MSSTSRYLPRSGKPSASQSNAQHKKTEQEELISMMQFQIIQLQRTIWLMATTAGGAITIDEQATSPLFDLKFDRPDPKSSVLTIRAALLPEMTTEQIDKIGQMLIGTKDDPGYAMDKLGLIEYPKSYVVSKIQPLAVWHDKHGWMARAEYDKLPKSQDSNLNQSPNAV